MKKVYCIRETKNKELFWSNKEGWTEKNFDTFSEDDTKELNLPVCGEWVLFQEKTTPKKIMREGQELLYLYSMGKRLRVTAIFTDEAEANNYMEKSNLREGVIAEVKPFIFLANLNDRGI